jgi:hypothetical protein
MKQLTPAEIPSHVIPYVSAVSVHSVTSLGRIKCRSFDSRNISRINKLHATDSSRSVSFSFPVSLSECHHRQGRLLSFVLPHFRPCVWLPMSHLNNILNVRAGVVCRVPGGRARRPHSLLSNCLETREICGERVRDADGLFRPSLQLSCETFLALMNA